MNPKEKQSMLDRLNAHPFFRGRLQFTDIRETKTGGFHAEFSNGKTATWGSIDELKDARRSREIIFRSTGVLIGYPEELN